MEIKFLDYIHPWLLEKMDFQIIQIFLFNTISINASIWNTQKSDSWPLHSVVSFEALRGFY